MRRNIQNVLILEREGVLTLRNEAPSVENKRKAPAAKHLGAPTTPPQLERDTMPMRRPRDALRSTLPTVAMLALWQQLNCNRSQTM